MTAKRKKARGHMITLRLSADEHRLFKLVADRYGLSVSSLIRMLVKEKK